MDARTVSIDGELMGRRRPTDPALLGEDVVRVAAPGAEGPAVDSIVLLTVGPEGRRAARYLSWIGYADLDHASSAEPGRWYLVEPPERRRQTAEWEPYGRGPLESVFTRRPSEARPRRETRATSRGARAGGA